MDMSTSSLQALKLPDLKTKCKEVSPASDPAQTQLGITGYSKLNKAQLIARLQEHNPSSATGTPLAAAAHANKASGTEPGPKAPPRISPIPHNTSPVPLATANIPPRAPSSSAIPSAGPLSSSIRSPAAPLSSAAIPPAASSSSSFIPPAAPSSKLPAVSKQLAPSPRNAINIPRSSAAAAIATSPTRQAGLLPSHAIVQAPLTTAPSVPRPTKLQKTTKASKPDPFISSSRKGKPAVVLTRTRPAKPPASVPAPSPSPLVVPHRIAPQSNALFLDCHFTSQILRQLRPELVKTSRSAISSRIMVNSIVNGGEEAFTISLRFYVSRLHTTLQMGGGEAWSVAAGSLGLLSPDITKWPVVTACKHMSGDVWSIENDNGYTYLCIGPTGEVIHRAKTNEPSSDLRSDWSAYLSEPYPLHAAVKSKDPVDFPRGISRSFADQAEAREVAERVVLSSCVLQRPVHVFGGDGGRMAGSIGREGKPSSRRSHRAVPATSAHLTQHPSVAIIQRNAGYSEYVLRETGQIIGDEDGICPLWQGLLACDRRGNHQEQASFWAGWEQRCAGGDE